jgi:hypothetical protein
MTQESANALACSSQSVCCNAECAACKYGSACECDSARGSPTWQSGRHHHAGSTSPILLLLKRGAGMRGQAIPDTAWWRKCYTTTANRTQSVPHCLIWMAVLRVAEVVKKLHRSPPAPDAKVAASCAQQHKVKAVQPDVQRAGKEGLLACSEALQNSWEASFASRRIRSYV